MLKICVVRLGVSSSSWRVRWLSLRRRFQFPVHVLATICRRCTRTHRHRINGARQNVHQMWFHGMTPRRQLCMTNLWKHNLGWESLFLRFQRLSQSLSLLRASLFQCRNIHNRNRSLKITNHYNFSLWPSRDPKREGVTFKSFKVIFVLRIRGILDWPHARPDKAIARPQKRGSHVQELQS